MSVANSVWPALLSAPSLAVVSIAAITYAVIAGIRSISQPGLPLPHRRFISPHVYVGWAVVIAVVTVVLVAAVSAVPNQEHSLQQQKQDSPERRMVPYERTDRAKPVPL